jgi:hypothetical protein
MTRSLLRLKVTGFLCGVLSLTRGRVCHFPESQSAGVSLLSACTIYILHVIKRLYIDMYVCVYTIYTRPLSVQAQCSRSRPIINCSCYNGSLVTPRYIAPARTAYRTPSLRYCLRSLPSNDRCLQNHYLARGLHATILSISGIPHWWCKVTGECMKSCCIAIAGISCERELLLKKTAGARL